MTTGEISKMTVATILGILVVHIWSIGEQKLALLILSTMIFNTFFIVGENKKVKNREKNKDILGKKYSNLFVKK